jgi:hypothetical protein
VIDPATLPRQQRRALEYLLAQPGQEYRTLQQVQDAIESTMRGTGNVLQRLLESGAVTCTGDENATSSNDWSWRAKRGRCESMHDEGSRSWRCQREARHSGSHISSGGGRRW